MRYLLFLLFLILGCQNNKPNPTPPAEPPAKEERTAITKVELNQDTMVLNFDKNRPPVELFLKGEQSNYLFSPDRSSIVVNTRVLSTVHITELFLANKDGGVDEAGRVNLSTIIWKELAPKYKTTPEDVLFPSTRAVKWIDGGKAIEIKVTGNTAEGAEIDEVYVYNLE